MVKETKNSNLHRASRAKEDEFYTQLSDIEAELKHYKSHFKNKVVYCNCDDPSVSNFFHYFFYNFEHLGLKKLIATCYQSQKSDLFSKHDSEQAVCLEYTGGNDAGGVPSTDNINVIELNGDGDFRSDECVEILKQADIVVTNPPFSLFREYVAQLIEYDKKFLIIGSLNAVTYKETFTLILGGRIWLGNKSGDMKFKVPAHYEPRKTRYWQDDTGQKWRSMGNICWYTNLDFDSRHEKLILYKSYHADNYPKYDGTDIINVDKVVDIPVDYDGIMGVPITFLNKHNPSQFKILGIANSARYIGHACLTFIDGKKIYNRVLIQKT